MKGLMARRKEIMLGGLLLALAVVLWRNLTSDAGSSGTAGPLDGLRGGLDIASMQIYDVPWVALEAARPSYDPAGRNIFQFGKPPPPVAPQLTADEEAAIREAQRRAAEERRRQQALLNSRQSEKQEPAQAANTPVGPPPPPPPPPKPTPPPINYKFIGYLGPADHKIAVLHDGKEMIFVSRGEELDNSFRVLEIGYESIKFGFTDPQFKDESRTLPMSSSL